MAWNEALEPLAGMPEEMKTVGNLPGVRSRPISRRRRVAGAVTPDHTALRVVAQPGRDRGAAPIRAQSYDLVGLQIDEHRPIGFAFPQGKISDPNLGRVRTSIRTSIRTSRKALPPQVSSRRGDRRGQMKQARPPACCFVGGRRAQPQQRLAKPLRHACSRQQEGWEAFGKDTTSTVGLAPEESSRREDDATGIAPTGNITNRPLLVALLRRRKRLARATSSIRWRIG
jgi:hypothetical protein